EEESPGGAWAAGGGSANHCGREQRREVGVSLIQSVSERGLQDHSTNPSSPIIPRPSTVLRIKPRSPRSLYTARSSRVVASCEMGIWHMARALHYIYTA